jgi:adenylate cyclase
MPDAGAAGIKTRRKPNAMVQLLTAAAPGLLVTALLLALQIVDLPATAELGKLVFDAYQRAAPRPYQDAAVRVVDIDDDSIAKLGQWPWPRTDIARLTQSLADAGAASISYDIVFSEPDRTSPARVAEILRRNPLAKGDYADIAALADHDVILGDALAKTPSVAGLFLVHQPNAAPIPAKAGFAVAGDSPIRATPAFEGAISPLPVIVKGAAGAGFVSIPGEGDGIVRTAPLLAHVGDQLLPALSLEGLRVAQGANTVVIKSTDASGEMGGGGGRGVVAVKVGQFEAPTTRSGALWMYYTAPHPERTVPAWKILTGALSPAEMKRLFEGHIVFVGSGASGLRDLVATPLSDRELGVMVHAQAVEQIVLGKFLVRPDWAPGLERFLVLVLGIGMSLSLPGLGALRGGIAAVGAFLIVGAASWFAFTGHGLLLDPTYPALGVLAAYITGTLLSFYREERRRAYIHHAFDRYLSPELVARIADDPSRLELGGEERDMTVMFCDIRGFSRLSEKLTPQQIIAFLIAFLTPMTDILLARKATIDKYIGDAILAFWNAPLDDPDHERNAAYAALAMVERLAQLNADQAADGGTWPGGVRIGIGLNAGPACVGNMGSEQRLNYSLIGDGVNLASRIEGLTKVYGVVIATSEAMTRRISDFALVELDLVRVVGRSAAEHVYTLLGPPELTADPHFKSAAAGMQTLLAAYRARDWDAADAAGKALAPAAGRFGLEPLLALYAERTRAARAAPPPADWNGVWDATEK